VAGIAIGAKMEIKNCYESAQDKREFFPSKTIPLIFRMAWEGRLDARAWLLEFGIEDVPSGVPQLRALHDLTRQGLYKMPEQINCDPPQSVAYTIANGGDCDQWASVTLAGMWVMGFSPVLITFGDENDSFQHVAAGTFFNFHWFLIDPKGSADGKNFDDWKNEYAHCQVWQPMDFGY